MAFRSQLKIIIIVLKVLIHLDDDENYMILLSTNRVFASVALTTCIL